MARSARRPSRPVLGGSRRSGATAAALAAARVSARLTPGPASGAGRWRRGPDAEAGARGPGGPAGGRHVEDAGSEAPAHPWGRPQPQGAGLRRGGQRHAVIRHRRRRGFGRRDAGVRGAPQAEGAVILPDGAEWTGNAARRVSAREPLRGGRGVRALLSAEPVPDALRRMSPTRHPMRFRNHRGRPQDRHRRQAEEERQPPVGRRRQRDNGHPVPQDEQPGRRLPAVAGRRLT